MQSQVVDRLGVEGDRAESQLAHATARFPRRLFRIAQIDRAHADKPGSRRFAEIVQPVVVGAPISRRHRRRQARHRGRVKPDGRVEHHVIHAGAVQRGLVAIGAEAASHIVAASFLQAGHLGQLGHLKGRHHRAANLDLQKEARRIAAVTHPMDGRKTAIFRLQVFLPHVGRLQHVGIGVDIAMAFVHVFSPVGE